MTTKVIISGHTRGLGAALAHILLDRGYAVLGLARHSNEALRAAYPGQLKQVRLDLGDTGQLQGWLNGPELSNFMKDAGQAVLINNAGMLAPMGALPLQALEQIASHLALNVTAALMLSSAFATATAGCSDRRIVHVSSGAARTAYPGWSLYCASKAALDHHARATALDAIAGLKIASIAPGVIDTDMQGEIRASTSERFPMRDRFVAMQSQGQLTPPAESAERLVEHVFSTQFGEQVCCDVRSL